MMREFELKNMPTSHVHILAIFAIRRHILVAKEVRKLNSKIFIAPLFGILSGAEE